MYYVSAVLWQMMLCVVGLTTDGTPIIVTLTVSNFMLYWTFIVFAIATSMNVPDG